MIVILQNTINTLLNDTVINAFVGDRIYPEGVDIFPETTLFPLITVNMVGEAILTNPKYEKSVQIQVNIWSRLSELEKEQITERVQQLLDYQQFNQGVNSAILRWQRQDAGVDLFESDRRIWHKALTFRCWIKEGSYVYQPAPPIPQPIYGEQPFTILIGVVDGVNKVFSFPLDVAPGFADVRLDGQFLSPGADYTISGRVITLLNAPIDNPPVAFYKTV
jgi:hypothetical protein